MSKTQQQDIRERLSEVRVLLYSSGNLSDAERACLALEKALDTMERLLTLFELHTHSVPSVEFGEEESASTSPQPL